MSYATPEELATALRIVVTQDNTALLQACLDAAADEIDHELDRRASEPVPSPAPALVIRVNVNRAVEWFKAPDAANGGVGFDQVGALPDPGTGFDRHAALLVTYKQQWGVA